MNAINFYAVGVATIASFVFGALWYSPVLFMKTWCREAGVDPTARIANPARVYGSTFLLTLLTACCLAFLLAEADPGEEY